MELIERVIYKVSDDMAVSVARSFERIEERIDAMESRLYSRLSDVEIHNDDIIKPLFEEIGKMRDTLGDVASEVTGMHECMM